MAVWTGTEMIVLWGWDNENEVDGLRTGGAYNPTAKTWRTIPSSPVAPRNGAAFGWTGEEMLFFGGAVYEGTIGDGAAYRPSTNSWRTLPESPLGERAGMAFAWTGERLVVWGGSSGYAESRFHGDGAAYDPKTNRWSRIAKGPLEARVFPAFAWTGRELIVWGGSGAAEVQDDSVTHPELLTDGAAYDPATNVWRTLPASPLDARSGSHSIWTGSELLVLGGGTWDRNGNDVPQSGGAAYDPATNRWRAASWPLLDRENAHPIWAGGRLVVWGGYRTVPEGEGYGVVPVAEGVWLDDAQGTWTPLPDAPIAPRYGHTMVWTGRSLILWGGNGAGSAQLSDGGTYTPA
jgi:hypothetical protein